MGNLLLSARVVIKCLQMAVVVLLGLVVVHEALCVDSCCQSDATPCCGLCNQTVAAVDPLPAAQPVAAATGVPIANFLDLASPDFTPPHPPPKLV